MTLPPDAPPAALVADAVNVKVALQREMVLRGRIGINAKSAHAPVPGIFGVQAVGENLGEHGRSI